MATRPILTIAMWLLSTAAFAQTTNSPPPTKPTANATYYSCKGADGSVVFSGTPCSTDPSKMREIDTSAALRAGSGESQGQVPAAENAADDDCHKAAYKAAYSNVSVNADSANQHIASYRERQQALAAQKVYASDGSGNLIDDPAAQQQIQDLNGSIEHEFNLLRQAKQNADTQYQAASKVCDETAALRQQSAKKN